tara:strand:- start:106 stop:327 length:222 start_codon:yes stop_codon:yes gene_type:complete
MSNLKSSHLDYPSVETWFIGWDNNRTQINTYGSVTPIQTMISPWNEMDYYEDEGVWLQVLLDNGINPFPEPED